MGKGVLGLQVGQDGRVLALIIPQPEQVIAEVKRGVDGILSPGLTLHKTNCIGVRLAGALGRNGAG